MDFPTQSFSAPAYLITYFLNIFLLILGLLAISSQQQHHFLQSVDKLSLLHHLLSQPTM